MIDNRTNCFGAKPARKDNVCVDSMQILDSCRDKDCFEDVRVYLTEFGQDVIEKTGNIKVKNTEVICVNVQADPVLKKRWFSMAAKASCASSRAHLWRKASARSPVILRKEATSPP